MENKSIICQLLLSAVRSTRAGSDVDAIIYDDEQEVATIYYDNGYSKAVNVACDSGIAMMRDILEAIH